MFLRWYLANVVNVSPSRFEDRGQVLDHLMLQYVSRESERAFHGTYYSSCTDVTLDEFARTWVHANGAGAVHGAIGYDCLIVDAFERRRGLVCVDDLLWHFVVVLELSDRFD